MHPTHQAHPTRFHLFFFLRFGASICHLQDHVAVLPKVCPQLDVTICFGGSAECFITTAIKSLNAISTLVIQVKDSFQNQKTPSAIVHACLLV